MKPSNVNEAVQLKKYVKETQPQMTKDIEAEIKAQKKRELFLEEYFWSTTDEDFDEICVSYGWPARMYEIMKLAGRACNSEHRLWEEKLKARREVFQTKLEEYKVTIESFERDGDVDKREEVYAGKVEVLNKALEEAANEAEAINDEEILFGWGITRYTEVTKLNTRFEPFKKLWTMTWETFKNHREWMQGPFSKLNSEVIDENVSDSVRDMAKLVKRFSGKGGGELMPKPLAVAEATAEKLEKFKDMLPMVHAVCNPGLRTRHWEKMTEIIAIPNFELKKDEFTSLQRLIDKGVKEHTVRLAEVSDVASREYTMEKALDKMVEDWEGLDLRFKPWKETGTSILDGACVDEVQAVLDDQIVKVTAMGASPFAKPFADRVGPWGARLDRLQQIVDQWLKCQAKWLYLEPIFSSDEIGKQIPTEAAAFDTMDTTWRKIMETGPGGAQGCGRAERGKLAGRSGRVQQATGHRREGTQRLFGHQEDGVPPLFLPVQRRAPGDFIRGQGSAPSAAVHEEVLRGCAKSGIHRARHDENHRVRGGRVRSAVQRDRPGGDGRGGEVDARVRGRHEGFVAQGDARIRGVLHHETERGVDFGLARAGGHRRVAGALDQRSHRRHRRGFFKGVRREVQRAADQHRQHGAGRVDQTGAGDDVGAGHHRRARPRRRRPDVSRRRARSQGLQVARAAALLLGGRHPQVPHDQRAGAVRL